MALWGDTANERSNALRDHQLCGGGTYNDWHDAGVNRDPSYSRTLGARGPQQPLPPGHGHGASRRGLGLHDPRFQSAGRDVYAGPAAVHDAAAHAVHGACGLGLTQEQLDRWSSTADVSAAAWPPTRCTAAASHSAAAPLRHHDGYAAAASGRYVANGHRSGSDDVQGLSQYELDAIASGAEAAAAARGHSSHEAPTGDEPSSPQARQMLEGRRARAAGAQEVRLQQDVSMQYVLPQQPMLPQQHPRALIPHTGAGPVDGGMVSVSQGITQDMLDSLSTNAPRDGGAARGMPNEPSSPQASMLRSRRKSHDLRQPLHREAESLPLNLIPPFASACHGASRSFTQEQLDTFAQGGGLGAAHGGPSGYGGAGHGGQGYGASQTFNYSGASGSRQAVSLASTIAEPSSPQAAELRRRRQQSASRGQDDDLPLAAVAYLGGSHSAAGSLPIFSWGSSGGSAGCVPAAGGEAEPASPQATQMHRAKRQAALHHQLLQQQGSGQAWSAGAVPLAASCKSALGTAAPDHVQQGLGQHELDEYTSHLPEHPAPRAGSEPSSPQAQRLLLAKHQALKPRVTLARSTSCGTGAARRDAYEAELGLSLSLSEPLGFAPAIPPFPVLASGYDNEASSPQARQHRQCKLRRSSLNHRFEGVESQEEEEEEEGGEGPSSPVAARLRQAKRNTKYGPNEPSGR